MPKKVEINYSTRKSQWERMYKAKAKLMSPEKAARETDRFFTNESKKISRTNDQKYRGK